MLGSASCIVSFKEHVMQWNSDYNGIWDNKFNQLAGITSSCIMYYMPNLTKSVTVLLIYRVFGRTNRQTRLSPYSLYYAFNSYYQHINVVHIINIIV